MRILIISNLYPPHQFGGYELGCRDIAQGLAARGHTVEVLTAASEYPDELDATVTVRRELQMRAYTAVDLDGYVSTGVEHFEVRVSQYVNTRAVLRRIEAFAPDHVAFFNLVGLGGIAIIDAVTALRLPWTWHLMDRVPAALVEHLPPGVAEVYDMSAGSLWSAGRFISMSRVLTNEIERELDADLASSTTIIPGWVVGPETGRRGDYRPNGITRFAFAGAMSDVKGVRLIVEAAQRLVHDGRDDFVIDLFGPGDASPYIELARTLGVSDRVRFHASRSQQELRERYAETDVFLFPSHEREPFGFAPLEAATMGCVAIITAGTGVSERLVDGVHCVKIQRSVDDLTRAMVEVMSPEFDLAGMGRRAQGAIARDLSFESILDRVEAVLSERSGENPSTARIRYVSHRAKYKDVVAIEQWNGR